MAFIECKKCGCQMSDKSEACPICGLAVGEEIEMASNADDNQISSDAQEAQELQSNDGGGKKKPRGIIWGVVSLCLLVLAGAFFVIYNNHNEVEQQNFITEANESNNDGDKDVTTESIETQSSTTEVVNSQPAVDEPTKPAVKSESDTYTYNQKGYVFGKYATLQSEQSVSRDCLMGYMAHGTVIDILNKDENWTKVRSSLDGRIGYVLSSNIVTDEEFSRYNKTSVAGYVFTEKACVRYRPNMSVEYIARYLTFGTEINILDKDGQWTKIMRSEDGSIAYIASEDIVNDEEFQRFNRMVPSNSLRHTLGKLGYRQALLFFARKYKDGVFEGIAFEKYFNDTENSVAIFNMRLSVTNEYKQCFVAFDESGNMTELPTVLSSNHPYVNVVVDKNMEDGRYNIIGDVVQIKNNTNIIENGNSYVETSISYKVIGKR